MKLTFRRSQVKDLSQLQTLVTEHAEAIESGFRVLAGTVNFGRSTVELVGLDGRGTPALVALGLTGDDAMLFRIVEAYAWSLEYPESVRRLMPAEGGADGWPPRVVFIAERLPESFLRKIRLLTFPAVNCFEYRCVDVNGATGFYLDAVDWARGVPSAAASPVIRAEEAGLADDVRREATTAPQRAATEDAAPAVTRDTQPSHWFGLLKRPSETPTAEPSPGRAESPAPVAASGAPIAGAPAMAAPWKVASQPATPTDDADLVRQLADNPEWQKFIEKLAAEDAPAATPTEKTARPAPEKRPTASHSGPSRNGGAGRRGDVKERLAGEPKERLAGEPKGREDRRQPPLRDVVSLPPNVELAPQWRNPDDRRPLSIETHRAVLRVLAHQEVHGPRAHRPFRQEVGAGLDDHPAEPRPVLVVAVHHERDLRVLLDVAHPPEGAGGDALGLRVDRREAGVPVEGVADRDHERPPGAVRRPEPRDTALTEELGGPRREVQAHRMSLAY